MWRRTYLLLALVRLYFALSPSYLHPDENFQGPEVIAGRLFPYPSHQTWEWTASKPVRSVFPLWPVYGLPMVLLKWVVGEKKRIVWSDGFQSNEDLVSPQTIYYALRVVMFILSFVFEDWAIHELIHSPRHRRQAIVLVASSYVTWTFQTHTFSNSLETILVLWSLVLIERILLEKQRSSIISCTILALLLVFGTFNRITFPAFILIPGLRLVPHLLLSPLSLIILVIAGAFFTIIAISTDTLFYHPHASDSFFSLLSALRTTPVIAPLNSLIYNTSTSNLALHGLHPHYQHLLVNLPQLLGPALFIRLSFSRQSFRRGLSNTLLMSALSGALILSILPHQEPRFLLPVIPLLLTCIPPLPRSRHALRLFWATWISFNIIFGILMGVYHQGAIVPTQLAIPSIVNALNSNIRMPISDINFSTPTHIYTDAHDHFSSPLTDPRTGAPEQGIQHASIYWWKTYPPPEYLIGRDVLDPKIDTSISIGTIALMGLPLPSLEQTLKVSLNDCTIQKDATKDGPHNATLLVFPYSALHFLIDDMKSNISLNQDIVPFLAPSQVTPPSPSGKQEPKSLILTPLFFKTNHLNLDDIDIPTDGIIGTIKRVVGMRGLVVSEVHKVCP